MVISFTSNNSAQITQRNMAKAESAYTNSLNKISTGLRVFSAREDATSLAIGTGLRAEVASLRAAQINTSQAVSMLQIADGALGEISSVVNRMATLASTAQSDQISDVQRGFLDQEFQLLLQEIDRISAVTQFNGQPLLGGAGEVVLNTVDPALSAANGFSAFEFNSAKVDNADDFEVEYFQATGLMQITNTTSGQTQMLPVQQPQPGFLTTYDFGKLGVSLTLSSSFDDTADLGPANFDVLATATPAPASLEFQVGTGTDTYDRIGVDLPLGTTNALGISGLDLQSAANAQNVFDELESATEILTSARATVGASLNRVENTASNLAVSIENTDAARSALLDVNVAEETTELTSQRVLLEAGSAVLAQANQRPSMLLKILDA